MPGSLLGVPALSLPLLRMTVCRSALPVLGYEQEDAAAFAMARWINEALRQVAGLTHARQWARAAPDNGRGGRRKRWVKAEWNLLQATRIGPAGYSG